MEDASRRDSRSGSSSDQQQQQQNSSKSGGWERFLPERALRILLVEDDTATLQVVNALLSKCGYEVSTATDGLKAWEHLTTAENSFDLVLADVMMPLLSGTDLLVKIMSSEAHKDIPVIMMSSQDSLDMVFKCLLKGAKDFLVKPVRKNELRNLWQHVWRRNHASAGVGNKGDNQGKKRKVLKSCTLSDLSNDNFSVSSGVDAGNVRENENAAQVSRQELSAPETKKKSSNGTLDLTGQALDAGLDEPHKHVECKLSEDASGLHSSQENSEATRRSGKAFDFIGNMAASDYDPGDTSAAKEILGPCQDSSGLDLTLRRASLVATAQCDPGGGQQAVPHSYLEGQQGVQQSNFSAFSKYTSSASFCSVARSAGLPTEPVGCNGPRPTLELCANVNERVSSSTLHFPKAVHIHQSRTSPLSLLASYRTEHGKHTEQDNCFTSNKNPSLNASTVANGLLQASTGTLTEVVKTNMQKESHFNTVLVGLGWCSTGSDKEDHGSNNVDFSQPSCSKVEWVGLRMDEYALQQQPISSSEVRVMANENGATTLHNLPGYRLVSGRGSNDGSDRGSCLLEEQMPGRSINGPSTQEQGSFGGAMVMSADDNSMMACYPPMPCNEGSFSAEPPSAYEHRSSFREAALHKFREKRKMRCFEKKVRYHSRKKLAEQRPRIKGQFVRRTVYDTAAEAKPTT